MCCEHDHQNRLSPRPPRRRYKADGGMPIGRVRIDQGVPHSPSPSQQVDHVIVRRDGVVVGRDGNPISGSIKSDPVNAHIPLSDWLGWSSWDRP